MINNSSPNYLAYLVRFWRMKETGAWRVILQDPHSGKQLHFDSPERMIVFFQALLSELELVESQVMAVDDSPTQAHETWRSVTTQ